MHQNVQLSSAPYGYYFINQVFLRQNAEVFFSPHKLEMHHDTFQVVGVKQQMQRFGIIVNMICDMNLM